jgi:hypothetical protein
MTKPFTLEVHEPFSTFTEGAPTPIPFVIDGKLPKAALSVIGAKAKHGKSSMSRCEAVAIAKGQPFLDRPTEQGEVLLCSLEDPQQHVDNHLQLLNYSLERDARIHIVSKLAKDVTQTVDAIANYLAKHHDIKFAVLDTLGKVLRANDSTNYDEMLTLCEQLHLLTRETGVHIQALTHCKKVQPEDPFDGFLGSVEVRAEPDTNIVIYNHNGRRFIQSETRMGIPWEKTALSAETEIVDQTQMVKRFYLGDSATAITDSQATAQEKNTRAAIANGIVTILKEHGDAMAMGACLDAVSGNRNLKFEVRDELIRDGLIAVEGVSHSRANPQKLRLLKPDGPAGIVIANPTPVSNLTSVSKRDGVPVARYRKCAGCPTKPHCWSEAPEGQQHCVSCMEVIGGHNAPVN